MTESTHCNGHPGPANPERRRVIKLAGVAAGASILSLVPPAIRSAIRAIRR